MKPYYQDSAVTLAYLAGAMDADGHLTIRPQTVRGCTTYSECVGLGQVTPIVPELLMATFGGTINVRNRNSKWRLFYNWTASNKAAAKLAETLLPFLKIKRRQAELICALRQSKNLPDPERRSIKRGRVRMTNPEVVAARVALYQEIKQLNKVGVQS